MKVKLRGLLKDDVKCMVSFAVPDADAPTASEPIRLMPYRMQSIAQTCRLAELDEPKTLTAMLKISWRGLQISAQLSEKISNTSVPRWWTIGPFNNPGGHAGDVKHPIETDKLDLTKKYPGQQGQIAWRKVERDPLAHVLAEHAVDFVKFFGQRTNAAAYALVWIDSDQVRDAVLAIGSDDGLVVWLNDKEVHRNLVARGYSSKQDCVPIHLEKGRNKLLLKVTLGIGDWNFCAHLLGTDGRSLEGISYSLSQARQP